MADVKLTGDESPTMRDYLMPRRTKVLIILKTIGLVAVWITMGMTISVKPVTLPDMLPRVGGNYETIMRAGSFSSFTAIAGFAFGIVCDKFPGWTDLVMSVSVLITSVTCVVYPWTRTLVAFGVNEAVYIFGYSLQNAVGNHIIAKMWKQDASGPLHFMHLGFGIGAFISPLIASPYLSPDALSPSNQTTPLKSVPEANWTTTLPHTTPIADVKDFNSSIEIPYVIIGSTGVVCMLVFVIFQIIGRIDEVRREDDGLGHDKTTRVCQKVLGFFSPGNWARGDATFGALVLLGMITYYTGLLASEGPLRYFLFSLAVESKLKFPKTEAVLLDSMFNLSFCIGRFASGLLSIFVPIQILIFTALSCFVVSTACLSFFLHSKIHLWVFACIYGFVAGPTWPAGYSWCTQYVTVTGSFAAWLGVFPSVIKFGLDWAVGYLFEEKPVYVMFFSLGFAGLVLLSMIVLQVVASRHGDRYSDADDSRINMAEVEHLDSENTQYDKNKSISYEDDL